MYPALPLAIPLSTHFICFTIYCRIYTFLTCSALLSTLSCSCTTYPPLPPYGSTLSQKSAKIGPFRNLLVCPTEVFGPTRAHSFGQFKKHALLKARTQSPCFSYPRLARAFISAGPADLSSFGGVSVGWQPDLPCWLQVYDRAKMRLVY
jgi:hypothetical protein